MKPVTPRTLAVALLLSVPFASLAQDAAPPEVEESSPFSATLAVTSDYVFRGLSQTDEGPAFQAGAVYSAPMGFYVGAWASNVDFGTGDPDFEVDTFVGYNTDIGASVNFDVMANRYNYPGAGASNYWELITKTTFLENYSVSVAYTDDVFGTDSDSWYYAAGASFGLPADIGLGLSAGVTEFESAGTDYKDWSVSLSKGFGPLTVSAAYIGTDDDGEQAYGDIAGDRVVVTATIGL